MRLSELATRTHDASPSRELRLGWAALVLVSLRRAFLPDGAGRWLVGLWIGPLIVGAVTLAMPRPASRALAAAGATLDSTRAGSPWWS